MNMKTRLKRAITAALAVLVIFGAGAIADTSTVPVTVGTVTGTRSLQVTGSDGSSITGPVHLAFGSTGTLAPFGTIVTDTMYKRAGFDVYAELSNLYPLDAATGDVDCDGTPIPSDALIAEDLGALTQTDLDAVLETAITLTDVDISDDLELLTGITGISLSSVTPVTIDEVPGLLGSVRESFGTVPSVTDELDPSSILFMNTTAAAGGWFDEAATHPSGATGCSTTGATAPSKVYLQEGTVNSGVDISALTDAIFTEASGGDGLSVTDAVTHGLLPPDATATTGTLYSAVEDAVEAAILSDLGSLVGIDLAGTTGNVIDDLQAAAGDVVWSLVAQTGAYPNVQTLRLDRTKAGSPPTGTYHGVMTVTLVDK